MRLDDEVAIIFLTMLEEEEMEINRCKEIERTIIKRYRKSIWRKFIRAIQEYDLIQNGDCIAVCVSGGKDSVLLAKLLQEVQRHGQMEFQLKFITIVSMEDEERKKKLLKNAKMLNIPIQAFPIEHMKVTKHSLLRQCYKHAQKLGCNKIAFGTHFDDVVETILMELLYRGKIQTKMPKQHSEEFFGLQLIRPMYLIKEADIITWQKYNQLECLEDDIFFREDISELTESEEKRQKIKKWIAQFRLTSDVIDRNIFRSMHDINLDTLIGYHTSEWEYCFLDDYK